MCEYVCIYECVEKRLNSSKFAHSPLPCPPNLPPIDPNKNTIPSPFHLPRIVQRKRKKKVLLRNISYEKKPLKNFPSELFIRFNVVKRV